QSALGAPGALRGVRGEVEPLRALLARESVGPYRCHIDHDGSTRKIRQPQIERRDAAEIQRRALRPARDDRDTPRNVELVGEPDRDERHSRAPPELRERRSAPLGRNPHESGEHEDDDGERREAHFVSRGTGTDARIRSTSVRADAPSSTASGARTSRCGMAQRATRFPYSGTTKSPPRKAASMRAQRERAIAARLDSPSTTLDVCRDAATISST